MTSSIATSDLSGQLRGIVDGRHLTDAARGALREWLETPRLEPLVLRDFLAPTFAEALAGVMRRLPVWVRAATILAGEGEDATPVDVEEATWESEPAQLSRHFVARPLIDALEPGAMSAEDQTTLKRFLAFAVTSGALRRYLAEGSDVRLEPATSLEFACYGPGDQILEHQDLVHGRLLAGNFYLDDEYREGSGARLGFRHGDRISHVDPLFNTFSLIPIHPDCHHWVEAYSGDGVGRYTVSIGQHAAVEEPS
jgi:hypothetical protein